MSYNTHPQAFSKVGFINETGNLEVVNRRTSLSVRPIERDASLKYSKQINTDSWGVSSSHYQPRNNKPVHSYSSPSLNQVELSNLLIKALTSTKPFDELMFIKQQITSSDISMQAHLIESANASLCRLLKQRETKKEDVSPIEEVIKVEEEHKEPKSIVQTVDEDIDDVAKTEEMVAQILLTIDDDDIVPMRDTDSTSISFSEKGKEKVIEVVEEKKTVKPARPPPRRLYVPK